MSDLVERLRSLAAVDNCQASLEAADEITRLTAEVEKLRAVLEMFACNCEGDDICFNIDNCRNYTARAALTQPTENPND